LYFQGMTGWVVLCLLSLCMSTPQVIRARQAARKPPFPSWVKADAPSERIAEEVHDDLAWSDLDDLELERLLSQSSS
jgi:predicted cobalt transporter CbtA